MIQRHPMCNDDLLREMLRADIDSQCDSSLMEHVETCSRCQQRLDELAADGMEWTEAVNVLSNSARAASDVAAPINTEFRAVTWTESMAKELLSPPTHPELLGRIGRYDVERLIGSGGMGVVFRAHDTELNRPVAIKLLAPYLASSGTARNRFAREARAAAGVVDDHVVPIHNVESENEPPFLVMQYVAGGSLQEKLDQQGPLDVAEVVRIGLQVAKGLSAAHAQGLIHRDVKPSNILLDEGVERAVLTDFGLARTESDACLTRSGFHPGTPHYMSPEQVRGETLDPRSDLFGLGCVLYSACAGHPPFRAESSYAVLRRITDESPRPIRQINSSIPKWLEGIIMKLLSKDRDQRFASAEEIAKLFAACLAHVQEPTTPLPSAVVGLVESLDCHDPASAKTESNGGFLRLGKLIATAACAIPLLLAGILITLETSKGTITIESEVDDVRIVIKKGDEVYDKLTVHRGEKSIRVYGGEYKIAFTEELDGLAIDGGEVRLSRRGQHMVKIVHTHSETEGAKGENNLGATPAALLGTWRLVEVDSKPVDAIEQLMPESQWLKIDRNTMQYIGEEDGKVFSAYSYTVNANVLLYYKVPDQATIERQLRTRQFSTLQEAFFQGHACEWSISSSGELTLKFGPAQVTNDIFSVRGLSSRKYQRVAQPAASISPKLH